MEPADLAPSATGQVPDVDEDGGFVMTDVQKRHNQNCYRARLSKSPHAVDNTLCLQKLMPKGVAEKFWAVGSDLEKHASVKKSLCAVPALGLPAATGKGWELKLPAAAGQTAQRARGYDDYDIPAYVPEHTSQQHGTQPQSTKVGNCDPNCSVVFKGCRTLCVWIYH